MNLITLLKRTSLLAVLAIAAGCSPAQPQSGQALHAPAVFPQELPLTATVENPATDRSYSDAFEIRFDGSQPWVYQLNSRNVDGLREMRLHIEGVDVKDNPGDIRLVTDGATTWMTGEGTDQACIQFPSHQGMDPTFIVPQTLFPPQSAQTLLGSAVEELNAGKPNLHFSGSGVSQGGWTDAKVDVWLSKGSQKLERLAMQATGNDPFFGTGTGQLTASYDTVYPAEGDIKPVPGCEVDVPLPNHVEAFVRLPEMASYESPKQPEKMVIFYQDGLTQAGWAEIESPIEDSGVVVLSYARGDQEVEIQVAPRAGGGSQVKLLFMKTQ